MQGVQTYGAFICSWNRQTPMHWAIFGGSQSGFRGFLQSLRGFSLRAHWHDCCFEPGGRSGVPGDRKS
jgi:hypothetical protein